MSMGGEGGGGFAEMIKKMTANKPQPSRAPKDKAGLSEMLQSRLDQPPEPVMQEPQPIMRQPQAGLPQEQPQQGPKGWNTYINEQMEKNPFGADPRTGLNMYGGRADSSITNQFSLHDMWQPKSKPYVHPVEMRRAAQARPEMTLPSERTGAGGNAIAAARGKRQAGLGR